MPKSHYLPLRLIDQHNGAVSAQEVDQYLDALEEPKRAALARLRQTILEILPEADQGISYGVPAFKVRGQGHRGVRRVQESPELPAAQRLGLSPAARSATHSGH